MKSASSGLIALLASKQFIMADLLTITTVSGAIYRYTSADIDLTVGGNLFVYQSVRFARGKTRVVIGVEVDTLDLTLYADDTMLLGGIPYLAAIHNGALDGARIKLERTFMASWGDTSAGSMILFSGRVADSAVSRTEAKLTVKSDLELLNIDMPRNLFTPNCLHTLFDSGCGLTKSSWAASGIILSSSTRRVLNCNLNQAAGFFDQGTVVFSSGTNSSVVRNIQSYVLGQITLNYPLPNLPAYGDAITAYPGCDKTQATCQVKFNNLAGFRGFPYVPTPETAL